VSVVGRYYPGDRRVYVDGGSIKSRAPVLAHEIVHMMNYMSGISDPILDEDLAYAFEVYIGNLREN
jgi:hypothetical protein